MLPFWDRVLRISGDLSVLGCIFLFLYLNASSLTQAEPGGRVSV